MVRENSAVRVWLLAILVLLGICLAFPAFVYAGEGTADSPYTQDDKKGTGGQGIILWTCTDENGSNAKKLDGSDTKDSIPSIKETANSGTELFFKLTYADGSEIKVGDVILNGKTKLEVKAVRVDRGSAKHILLNDEQTNSTDKTSHISVDASTSWIFKVKISGDTTAKDDLNLAFRLSSGSGLGSSTFGTASVKLALKENQQEEDTENPFTGISNWPSTTELNGYIGETTTNTISLQRKNNSKESTDTVTAVKVVSTNQNILTDSDIKAVKNGDISYQIAFVPKAVGATTVQITIDAEKKGGGQYTIGPYSRTIISSNYRNAHSADVLAITGDSYVIGETANLSRGHYLYPSSLDQTMLWECEDSSIATVDEFGYLTALKVGDTKVKGYFKADSSVSFEYPVRIRNVKITDKSKSDDVDLNGKTLKWDVSSDGASIDLGCAEIDGTASTTYWYSSNTDVATVSKSNEGSEGIVGGKVTFKKNGAVTIVAKKANTKTQDPIKGTVTFEVTGAAEDAKDRREAITPLTEAQGSGGSNAIASIKAEKIELLAWNANNDVVFEDYIQDDVSDQFPSFTFTINPAGKGAGGAAYSAESQAAVRAASSQYEKELARHVSLKSEDGSIVATGTEGLKINAETVAPEDGSARYAAVSVTVNQALKLGGEYVLVFDSGTFGPMPISIYSTGTNLGIGKSAEYHFTPRAALTDDMVADIKDITLTSGEVKPEITVTYNGAKLTEGDDFSVSIKDFENESIENIEKAGTYTAVINGKGGFTGTVRKEFKVVDAASSGGGELNPTTPTTPSESDSDVKAVIDAINALPAADSQTAADADAVARAQAAYDALTDAQKAIVDATVGTKLQDAVAKAAEIAKPGEKLKNTLTVKGKIVKVKAAKLKKKAQTVKASKALKVSKAKGTVTYKKVSGKKNFKVNKKTGKITIKKGTKKGTYKVKIKVAAAGDADYLSASKTVTVKIRVK